MVNLYMEECKAVKFVDSITTVSFQHFLTKNNNAVPIFGVCVCALNFLTCPTVFKVMSLQTKVELGRSR